MKGLMKEFKGQRVTTYFRDYAIFQIKMSYRLMEYLEPDKMFPPKDLSPEITDRFLKNDVAGAVEDIMEELGIDISCSSGSETFKLEAIELATELLEASSLRKRQELLSEKEQLLMRLKKLDEEIAELD